jgi:hypothetical protein
MAKNTGTNNRIPVKWVRDKAKAAYEKRAACHICGAGVDLELHHLLSITILLEEWASAKGYDISTDDGILAVRDEFIEEHKHELYDQVYTLCNRHHVKLHGIYGKKPPQHTASKQERWIELQRNKYLDGYVETKVANTSFFSQFT